MSDLEKTCEKQVLNRNDLWCSDMYEPCKYQHKGILISCEEAKQGVACKCSYTGGEKNDCSNVEP